jgi:Chaperone of endosialidase
LLDRTTVAVRPGGAVNGNTTWTAPVVGIVVGTTSIPFYLYASNGASVSTWGTTGNTGTTTASNWVGTNDNVGFNLRANGANRISISTAGVITFNNLSSGTMQSTAGVISVISDMRMKTEKAKFTKGVEAVKNIEPITYEWNEESGLPTGLEITGFSAQNIRDNIPEAVSEDKDGYLGLNDRAILATLVNSIKELNARIEVLEK